MVFAEAVAESELAAILAAERGLGFGLLAFAVLGERLCCCVLVPASAADAEARMIGRPFVCKLRTELLLGREPGTFEWLLARPSGQWID